MPDEFTWLSVPGVNQTILNQGKCGSCWAFAAVGALEMQSVISGNEYVNLSRQQAIDWFVLIITYILKSFH